MAVTYSNKGTMGYGTGAVNATVPSGYAKGDLLVLVISGRNALPALPSGWTDIGTVNNSTYIYNRTCYKIATASESTVAVADSGSYTTALMLLFKGNATTNPINALTTNIGSGTTFSATGVTTTKANCMIVHCTAFQDAGTASDTSNYDTPSNANLSSLTERHDAYYRSGTNINGGIYVVTGLKATAGDTGNTTSTADASGNYSAVVTFAIAPPIPHTLTITYKDAQGNTLATSHSSQVNEGAGYSVNSPTVAGYIPDQATVSGTMGTSDVNVEVVYTLSPCILTLTPTVTKIAGSGTSSVSVSSNINAVAFEARATLDGQGYGRGIGIDIVQDDVSVTAGVHTFVSPTKSWSFDIAYSEIGTDGLYRISVYAQNEDGVWSS